MVAISSYDHDPTKTTPTAAARHRSGRIHPLCALRKRTALAMNHLATYGSIYINHLDAL